MLLFATIRDEAVRLPHFLDHYRALGVSHFLFVDNESSDGTLDLLRDAADVVRELTTGPQVLVGSSMGGWIALLLMRMMLSR